MCPRSCVRWSCVLHWKVEKDEITENSDKNHQKYKKKNIYNKIKKLVDKLDSLGYNELTIKRGNITSIKYNLT